LRRLFLPTGQLIVTTGSQFKAVFSTPASAGVFFVLLRKIKPQLADKIHLTRGKALS
jgi:hypothetical protein